ncbi:hypothetical protein ACH4C2_12385 [Streptomyces sp. NPDC018057]|uniref:hypothetical protein n=1 Tax=unclassified Streptomyces TaxID=2593676 RepID=UPI0037B8EF89
MSLVELIVRADERGLAASGLACLDRCVPLLGGADAEADEVLRPLWGALTDEGGDWGGPLERARTALAAAAPAAPADEAALLARRMLDEAPAGRAAGAAVREWADACSVASLRIHRLLDRPEDSAPDPAGPRDLDAVRRAPGPAGARLQALSPLVAAELRRQITVLELLAGPGPGGLRGARDVATEGRRVLRAALSRRARGRG